MSVKDVFTTVEAELDRQLAKWGEQDHSGHEWYAIIGEEVGEVGKGLNENDLENYRDELIDVIACCVRALENSETRFIDSPVKQYTHPALVPGFLYAVTFRHWRIADPPNWPIESLKYVVRFTAMGSFELVRVFNGTPEEQESFKNTVENWHFHLSDLRTVEIIQIVEEKPLQTETEVFSLITGAEYFGKYIGESTEALRQGDHYGFFYLGAGKFEVINNPACGRIPGEQITDLSVGQTN